MGLLCWSNLSVYAHNLCKQVNMLECIPLYTYKESLFFILFNRKCFMVNRSDFFPATMGLFEEQ